MAMVKTLLRTVQDILASMDSDEVSDIADTAESLQVVSILESTYYDIAAQIDFPDNWDLFELDAYGDVNKPTLMKFPANVGKLEWVKYDSSDPGDTVKNWNTVSPMTRSQWFKRQEGLDSSLGNVYHFDLSVGTGTFDVRGYNDRAPTYFTTTDDNTLIFDSYDAGLGQTLISNQSRCYGMIIPEFVQDNDFIVPIEPRQFTLYYNEGKSQCWADLKQQVNAKAEQRAKRAWNHAHRKSPQVPLGDIKESWTNDYGKHR